jgi:hypothetical protein
MSNVAGVEVRPMEMIDFSNIKDFKNVVWAPGRRPAVDQRTRRIRAVFSLLAWIGAIAGAIYAYRWMSSYALAIFVFLMVVHVVGRGIPDVITDPNKIQRVLFFALYPAICTAVVYYAYQWWGRMWLAVILGLVLGAILSAIAGTVLFPRVAQEEMEDTKQRMTRTRQ